MAASSSMPRNAGRHAFGCRHRWTPLLAMLRHIVYEGIRTRRFRPTWFFYAARSKTDRAFDTELTELVAAAQGAITLVRLLSHADGAIEGRDYDAIGRIDETLLTKMLPLEDCDFYLCGPAAFTQSIYDSLRRLDVRDERVHAEAFGPGSLNRSLDKGLAAEPLLPAATAPVPICLWRLTRWRVGCPKRDRYSISPKRAASPMSLAAGKAIAVHAGRGSSGAPLLMGSRHPTRCATARLSFASPSLPQRTPDRSRPSISTSDPHPPAGSDDRVSACCGGVAQQELKLSQLVAAAAERHEIVALGIDFGRHSPTNPRHPRGHEDAG